MDSQNFETPNSLQPLNLQMVWSGLPENKEDERASEILHNFWNLPHNLLAIANPDTGTFEELTPAWEKTLGFSLDELKSREWIDFVHPDDRGLTNKQTAKLKTGINTIGFENRYLKSDGTYAWLSWISNPIGNKLYYRVTDVTDKVLAREKSLENEKRFKMYADAMPQMAFIADPLGNMLYFNRRHYEYMGLTPQDEEGWKWRDQNIVHPDDLQRTVETWTNSLDTGAPYDIEYRLRRYDGVYRWHLGRAFPIKDQNGVIHEWFGTNTDIHDSKMAAEEMKVMAARLKEVLHARDEFLSIASHELKTPITSLKLKNQMQMRSIARGETGFLDPNRYLENAFQTDRQITRLTRLVDDMLDVSKIRLSKFNLEPGSYSLEALVRDVVQLMTPQFVEAGIPVPEIKILGNPVGRWDKLRIEQIFQNILLNTIKYAGPKQSLIIIKKNSSMAQISFIDQGPGISPDIHHKIFQRFERGISANEVSGLGLGLFISQQLAIAHGGRILVESTMGEGSTFTVELPI